MSKKKVNKPVIFVPDSRNLGGRNEITNLIYNHQISLLNAKPTIKTRISSPKSTTSKKRPVSYKEIIQFKEVFESFRRSGNVKWTNFSSPPKTFFLKEMLCRKNTKAYKSAEFEHQLFLNSQKRRIDELVTVSQRKKNAFDYKMHPSLFFRRKLEGKKSFEGEYEEISENDEEIQPTCKQINIEKNQEINKKNKEIKKEKKKMNKEIEKDDEKINKNNEEIIEEDQENETYGQENDENEYTLIPIPQMRGKSEEDYKSLKGKLIEMIYEYRVFKSDDLESLFGRTLLHNKQMDSKKLQKIFKEIQDEFDA